MELALTVYNSDIALVRDVRNLQLARGTSNLRFMDIAATVNPATVHFRSLSEPSRVSVLEQNYEYDLLEPDKLLRKYVGRDVTLVRLVQRNGATQQEEVKARLLSYNNAPVWQIGSEIVTGLHADHIRFPELPGNLYSRPTLIWTLDNGGTTRHRVEASYLAGKLSWNADYVLTVARDDKSGDIDGWVTLTNGSGTSFPNAKLQLVAGDLNRVKQVLGRMAMMAQRSDVTRRRQSPWRRRRSRTTTCTRSGERRPSTTTRRSRSACSAAPASRSSSATSSKDSSSTTATPSTPARPIKDVVQVFYQFKNEERSGLGMPMPAGVVRVYQSDSSGGTQFVGEDRIDHTPKDETLNLKIGNAFDVVAERKQIDFEKIAASTYEVEYADRGAQPQVRAGDRRGERAARRNVADAALVARMDQDGRVGRAVPGARGGQRLGHAQLPRARHVLMMMASDGSATPDPSYELAGSPEGEHYVREVVPGLSRASQASRSRRGFVARRGRPRRRW